MYTFVLYRMFCIACSAFIKQSIFGRSQYWIQVRHITEEPRLLKVFTLGVRQRIFLFCYFSRVPDINWLWCRYKIYRIGEVQQRILSTGEENSPCQDTRNHLKGLESFDFCESRPVDLIIRVIGVSGKTMLQIVEEDLRNKSNTIKTDVFRSCQDEAVERILAPNSSD